jgi:hypothetical protein
MKKSQLLNKDGFPVFLHDDHKKPVTRRDFLSTGLLSFSGYMFAPSILSTIFTSQAAQAAGCAATATNTLPSFMSINFSGGPGITGYFVPMGKDGSTIPSYSSVGLGTAPGIQTVFNGVPVPLYNATDLNGSTNKPISPVSPITAATPPSTNLPAGAADPTLPYISQFFQGLLLAINPDIQAKTAWVSTLVSSQDDSSANSCNVSGLVQAAGYVGDTLPALGTEPTATGISNMPAQLSPSAPSVVGSFADITNAISLHQKVKAQLNNDPKLFQSMLNLVKNLSGSQARTLASANGSGSAQTLGNLVSCATGKNYDLSTAGSSALDPMNNAAVSSIWSLGSNATMASMNNGQRYAYAGMAWNLLNGHSGTVGINLGGNDYHGNPRTTTDLVDFRNGTLVGNMLATAAAIGKPLFIHVTADGATGSNVSTMVSDPSGDRGIGGAQFMIAYHPAGRPAMLGNQLGNFTNSQGADSSAVVGSDPSRAAVFAFRNYLQFASASNAQSMFSKIIAPNTSADIDAQTLPKILKFA